MQGDVIVDYNLHLIRMLNNNNNRIVDFDFIVTVRFVQEVQLNTIKHIFFTKAVVFVAQPSPSHAVTVSCIAIWIVLG